jgi:hypothetical protein
MTKAGLWPGTKTSVSTQLDTVRQSTLKAFRSAAQRLCFVSRAFLVFQEEFFRLVAIQGFNGNGTSAAGEA